MPDSPAFQAPAPATLPAGFRPSTEEITTRDGVAVDAQHVQFVAESQIVANGEAAQLDADAGAVGPTTRRVTLASDDPAVTLLTAIETAVDGIEAALAALSTAANQATLIGHVDGIEGQLTTLIGHVDGLEAAFAPLSTAANQATIIGHIDGIEAALAALATAANQATIIGHVDGIEAALATLIGHVDGLEALLGAVATEATLLSVKTSVELLDDVVKAEDAAHASGDKGIMTLAVRSDSGPVELTGTDGDYEPITARTGRLFVNPLDMLRISVQSGGLTTATTAYTGGDQLGTEFTLANAARAAGRGGYITGIILVSAADVIGPVDVVFTRESITLAGDNASWAISDADAIKIAGLVQLIGAFDIGNNRICQAHNIRIPYDCVGTSLFASIITRSDHTFFGAVGDLQLIVTVERN